MHFFLYSFIKNNFTNSFSDENLISDDQLLKLSTKEINKFSDKMPTEVIVRLKQRRRTLKNRNYASSCRLVVSNILNNKIVLIRKKGPCTIFKYLLFLKIQNGSICKLKG